MTNHAKALKRGLYLVVAVLALCFVFTNILKVAPASLQLAPASDTCNQRQAIATGQSPDGSPWAVMGWIRQNGGSCKAWLFGVEFTLAGRTPDTFSSGWGIPPGGHLPRGFTFSGHDRNEGTERVFAGAAGVHVKSLLLTMSNRRQITIYPLLPTPTLRKRFVWLRNLRYFVQFYPTGLHIRLVTARNSKGRIVAKSGGEEGFFEGRCSPVISCLR